MTYQSLKSLIEGKETPVSTRNQYDEPTLITCGKNAKGDYIKTVSEIGHGWSETIYYYADGMVEKSQKTDHKRYCEMSDHEKNYWWCQDCTKFRNCPKLNDVRREVMTIREGERFFDKSWKLYKHKICEEFVLKPPRRMNAEERGNEK